MTRCVKIVEPDCGLRRNVSGELSARGLGGRTTSGQLCLAPASAHNTLKAAKHTRRLSAQKIEFDCRQALVENQLSSDDRGHRRQNSLSSALEGLDLEEAFPSENRDVEVVPQPEHRNHGTGSSFSSVSKTARRRAEYDSKTRGATFNQRKHMSPSYIRRLERREMSRSRHSSPEPESLFMASSPFEVLASPLEARAPSSPWGRGCFS